VVRRSIKRLAELNEKHGSPIRIGTIAVVVAVTPSGRHPVAVTGLQKHGEPAATRRLSEQSSKIAVGTPKCLRPSDQAISRVRCGWGGSTAEHAVENAIRKRLPARPPFDDNGVIRFRERFPPVGLPLTLGINVGSFCVAHDSEKPRYGH